jgi:hypothetical protein
MLKQEKIKFTTVSSDCLVWLGKEQAMFKIDKLFNKREVAEMQSKINTIDDFMEYMNEFYRRSELPNYAPFDLMINGEYEPILKPKN